MNQRNTNTPPAIETPTEILIERKRKSLEAIFDAVSVGLLLVDENLVVIRVNNKIRKMTGGDYADIINRPLGKAFRCPIITPREKTCGLSCACQSCPFKQNIQKVFETSQPVHDVEFQSDTFFQNRDQKPWFSMDIEPIITEDSRYAVVCLNDITEKKLAEEKLVETMEMKSQFISTVSHELRTPLTALLEGLNIVLEGLAGRVKKKQMEFLNLAKRNADRLSLLINDVLDFQKLEAGRMRFDFSLNSVAQVVKEARDTVNLAAEKNKITLTVKLADDLGEAVFDHNRIFQVLINLLSNAIKFTPQGGNVSIEALRQQDEIVITVSDSGMGIPKDDLPMIFERFYRVKRPGKEIPGTGLGLSIVAQIINHHNGRILVESELNKGTIFTIYFPINPARGEPDIAADEAIEKTITNQ